MINIDFSLAVGLYALLFLSPLIIGWISGRKEKDKDLTLNPKFIWFCSICTYTYVNTREDSISVCPRCGNYNKK
ncbi:MAG TPA: hypothetical protein VMD04_00945 [Candidatus Margulisiibacteriota bacterium]|nr:hypothetical protein [Candidatus Margulisiibacteriota bacterium]